MTKIIAICGKKTSGKTTLCNFLHGYQLKSYGIIDDFDLTEKGKLVIKASGENGEVVNGMIDIMRRDEEFATWAAYNMWPFAKQYSFASALKEMAIGLFGVPYECLYGTNEQKEQKISHLLWENMPGVITPEQANKIIKTIRKTVSLKDITPEEQSRIIYSDFRDSVSDEHNLSLIFNDGGITIHEAGQMTGREFMQFMGTEVMRSIYENIWADNTINEIQSEESQLSLIDDARFDNEIAAIQKIGGKVIYLDRIDSKDNHSSENGFNNSIFDATINARGMSMLEMCQELVKIIDSWGWRNEVVQ